MKKYPYVRQIGIKDCGVACLKMILQFYGGNESLERLRNLTNTTKEGTSAFDLIKGAKKLGFDATGYQATIDQIQSNQLPVIAYTIINQTYQHYMVIYEITKKWVLVGDPSTKLKRMKHSEFESIFQNVILVFEPLMLLPNHKDFSFLKRKTTEIMKSQKKYFLLLAVLTIAITLRSIILTLPIRLAVDFTFETIPVGLYMFFAFLLFFQFLFQHFQAKISIQINKITNTQLWSYLMEKIFFLPYQYYRNHTTGEMISKIQDFEKINEWITVTFSNTLIDALMIFFLSIFMCNIHVSLFIITLLVVIIFTFFHYFFQKKRMNMERQIIENRAILHSQLVESISGFETIKGLNLESNFCNRLNENYQNILIKQVKMLNQQFLESHIQSFFLYLGSFAILVVGLSIKELSLGSVVLFSSFYTMFLDSIFHIINWIYKWKEIKISIQNMDDLIIEGEKKNNLISQNLQISYQNLDITVIQGEKILLLGKSGIGKSALLKMIKKYYNNSFVYPELKEEDIVYISQNEILFTDTIYNNITIGNKNKSELNRVIKLCEMDSIISRSKLGLNALIEENGYNLSGGEKERIFLARALLSQPKILLVDETFSQMDVSLERRILRNLIDHYENMTVIVVSHRTDNKDLFHHVYTLEGGNK